MQHYLFYSISEQPTLCILINKIIKKDKNNFISRADISGSVVCHLGEVHLKRKAKGKIINLLKLKNKKHFENYN